LRLKGWHALEIWHNVHGCISGKPITPQTPFTRLGPLTANNIFRVLDLPRKSAGYLSHLRRQFFKRERAFAA
jgi:hypothetical protein